MELGNPYFIDEPAVISLSGGRTSGYMLYKILEAHGGLPDHIKVIFANTGKELDQTLDFVRDMGERWGIEVTWVEARVRTGGEGENKYVYSTVVVDYNTASRDGRPFNEVIWARNYLPNPMMRFCTSEMKVLRIKEFIRTAFLIEHFLQVIGIRADEPHRATKMTGLDRDGDEYYLPLNIDRVSKQTIHSFWTQQNFNLDLPMVNGVTDWGNCTLCPLKGGKIRQSIIRTKPDLADWWIEKENEIGGRFRYDQPTYAEMKAGAEAQLPLIELDNHTIPCFCGD